MAAVAVLTDSTACIPNDMVARYGIHVIPMTYVFEDRVYQDQAGAPLGEFYRTLRQSDRPPATAPPTPGMFIEAFRAAASEAHAILCVTLPSRLSSLRQSACLAADTFRRERPDVEVRVLDSNAVALAQGFVVLAAARVAEAGKGLEDAVLAAQAVMSRVRLVAVLDTLHYLAKGGRVSWPTAWAAMLLSVRPVIEVARGEIRRLGTVRSRAAGVERMLGYIGEHAGQRPIHAGILHGDVPDDAERLRRQVEARFPCVETLANEITPVMGMHTGPGVPGIAFYTES